MEIISNENFELNNLEDWETFPIKKTWKNNFDYIKNSIVGMISKDQEKKIISKIDRMIHILVEESGVYEDIVLNTAQLYVFFDAIKSSTQNFKDLYSKYELKGVEVLINNNLDEVFNNTEMLYLEKIKLAEYIAIYETKGNDNKLDEEIDFVVKNYYKVLNKNLLKILNKLRGENNEK